MNAAIASRGIFTFDALGAPLREIAGVSHFLIRANDDGRCSAMRA